MNNSNIATLQNTLQSSISTMTGLHSVYEIETSDPAGFPFSTITFDEMEDEVFDTNSNQFLVRFSVKILDEFTGKIESKSTTEDRLLGLLDSALDLIRNEDYSSIGYDFRPKINIGRPEYVKIGEGTARQIELLVEFKEKINLT